MGFNPPVPFRKRSSSAFTRFVIWSCYLLADWVADLALSLLLNNMGNIGGGGGGSVGDLAHRANVASLKHVPAGGGGAGGGGGSPIIFAFWAPFLLLHLGGPDTITAYSLADNELWHRHLIGLLFELSAAAVVFLCSLRGNKMVTATVLMFASERTYSLYSGSSGGFRDSILGKPDAESTKVFTRLMREFSHRTNSGLPADLVFTNPHEEISSSDMQGAPEEMWAYELFLIFRPLFVNGVVSSTKVKMTKDFFLKRKEAKTAIEILEQEINYAYDILYTKMPVLRTMAGYILRFVGCCCVISSLVIFTLIDKAGMLPADVCITYALLLSAIALDAAALIMLLFSDWTPVFVHESKYSKRLAWLANPSRMAKRWSVRRWSRKVKQMNLLDDIPETTTQRVREIFSDFISTCLGRKSDEGETHLEAPSSTVDPSRSTVDEGGFSRATLDVMRPSHAEKPSPCRARAVPPDDIMVFIFEVFKDAIKNNEQIKELRIKELRDCRGDGFLGRLRVEDMKLKGKAVKAPASILDLILSSVTETDFDESLLMWHIATNLCYFDVSPTAPVEKTDKKPHIVTNLCCFPVSPTAPRGETHKMTNYKLISKNLSDYMLYLLIKKPEMMSATIGIGLFRYRSARAAMRLLLKFSGARLSRKILRPQDVAKVLLGTDFSANSFLDKIMGGDRSKTLLFNACLLANALRELNSDIMWEVVAGVWAEMLTYAAARTPLMEHLAQLSHGGELITLVWFLMEHMDLSGSTFETQRPGIVPKLLVDY